MINNQEIKSPVFIQGLGIKNKTRYGIFKCYCGNLFETRIYSINSGHTKSCGCYKPISIKHGKYKERIYLAWQNMKRRCYQEKTPYFKNYGGRGIVVCDKWRDDFKEFYDWAMSNGYNDSMELDRIDSNGNYSAFNCRWVDAITQAQNRGINSNNTSGYKGVSFYKSKNKWIAEICVNYDRTKIGSFKTAEEAAKAYNDYVVSNGLEHPLNIISDLPKQQRQAYELHPLI